jgi:hypothetical protein
MERAMGIEPTSEAWEACFIALKTHKLAAFCRFSEFLDGFQLEQRKHDGMNAGSLKVESSRSVSLGTKLGLLIRCEQL